MHLHVVGLQLSGDLARGAQLLAAPVASGGRPVALVRIRLTGSDAQVAGVPGQAALTPLVQVHDLGTLDTGREVLAAHHHAKVESAEGGCTEVPSKLKL